MFDITRIIVNDLTCHRVSSVTVLRELSAPMEVFSLTICDKILHNAICRYE